MVTLLMRASELVVGEKLSVANVEHGRLQQEKVVSRGENEGHLHKTSLEGRSRAKKGRNAHKKQPQRGLGVAQLEKLRLQEQSKQEATCSTSLQGLPLLGFTDQNGCFRPMKSRTMSHQPGHSNGVSFCSGRTEPPQKLSHYRTGDDRQLRKDAVDGDVFRTIISLANSDHSTAGSFARHTQGGLPVAFMLLRKRGGVENSYSMRTVPSLTSLYERPVSAGQGSCGTNAYAEESSSKLPSCVVACLGSPSSKDKSLFSNSLTTGVNLGDSLASNLEQGEHHRSEADSMFQVTNDGVGDAGMVDAKLFPVGKNGSLQCFKSSSGPVKLRRLSQDLAELPVVELAVNCGRPKELSSFQSFSSNNTWSATEKICGQKRLWQDVNVNTSKLMHSESLYLNVPVGDVEVAHGGSVAQAHKSPVEVHHTLGINRSGLSNVLPLLDKLCATCQENQVQNVSTTTDVCLHSVDSFSKVSCPPQSKIKDCSSSVCSPSGSPVSRQRCLSSSEVPVLMGVDLETSGDFLTLGMSSRSYPTSPQLGIEVDSKESMNPEVGHLVKRSRNSQAQVDNNTLQLQMSNRNQESSPSVTGVVYSPSFTDNDFLSAVGLSCRFTSTSSNNMTEDCQNLTGREERRELDLRLKLAL